MVGDSLSGRRVGELAGGVAHSAIPVCYRSMMSIAYDSDVVDCEGPGFFFSVGLWPDVVAFKAAPLLNA